MKAHWERFNALVDKKPIIKDILVFFLRTFLIVGCSALLLYMGLRLGGVYDALEATLDLKHNSKIFMIPIWVSLAATALCGVVGLLMYFHKYKRPINETPFTRALAPVLVKKR